MSAEGKDVVTMVDVLQEEEDLEQDANAVLGGSDDQHCTYSAGYVSRQALYLCTTCCPESKEPAGVCLACSYKCHEGHDLVELYTKRNFRCDCGNSKFENKCQLETEKDSVNEKNSYNQNFKGVYCTCARPYPDPEDSVEDEMIQCIICEDWYHSRHLGEGVDVPAEFSEMICGGCVVKLPFISIYKSIEVVEECPLKDKELPVPKEEAVFWQDGWRSRLCSCSECKEKYQQHKVEFLCDSADMVQEYEKQGLSQPSQMVEGMKALENMDRSKTIEAVEEYKLMQSELKTYLSKFAAEKRVVTEDDIRGFFEDLKAKRRRMNGPLTQN